MAARAEDLVAPLVEAGWRVVGRDREESDEFGDSVFCDLERAGTTIELELYETSDIIMWPVDPSGTDDDDEDDLSDPLFSLEEPTADDLRSAVADWGWLEPG